MSYGKAIKKIRALRGLSQRDLAVAVGVDASYVSHIENGNRIPGIDKIEKIAKGLGVPPYLLVLLASDNRNLKGKLPQKDKRELAESLLSILMDTHAR